jgi:hypothetical protein
MKERRRTLGSEQDAFAIFFIRDSLLRHALFAAGSTLHCSPFRAAEKPAYTKH